MIIIYFEARYIKVNYKQYSLLLDFFRGKLIKRERNKQSESFIKVDKSSLLLNQLNNFLHSINQKKFSNKNFLSSVNVTRLIGKLKKSSLSNSEIKIY